MRTIVILHYGYVEETCVQTNMFEGEFESGTSAFEIVHALAQDMFEIFLNGWGMKEKINELPKLKGQLSKLQELGYDEAALYIKERVTKVEGLIKSRYEEFAQDLLSNSHGVLDSSSYLLMAETSWNSFARLIPEYSKGDTLIIEVYSAERLLPELVKTNAKSETFDSNVRTALIPGSA